MGSKLPVYVRHENTHSTFNIRLKTFLFDKALLEVYLCQLGKFCFSLLLLLIWDRGISLSGYLMLSLGFLAAVEIAV